MKKTKLNKLIIIIFLLIFSIGGVTAATITYAKDIKYDNSINDLNSNNVQDAIDEVYDKLMTSAYNVSFDTNGGNIIDIKLGVKYGQKYTILPTPTHNNSTYTFSGWYTEEGEKIETTSIVNSHEAHVLKARWMTPTGYEIVNDVNKDGIVDIGDEIAVGTENFYVISHTDTELNALAKYNLKVGNIYSADGKTLESTILTTEEGYGRQDAQMRGFVSGEKRYGAVEFSKVSGWPYENNDTINIRNEAYRVGTGVDSTSMTALDALYTNNETTGIKGYEIYIQETIQDAKVRLIDKSEIEVLIKDGNTLSYRYNIKEKADAKGYTWLYSTSYWTQSAGHEALNSVCFVDSAGLVGYTSYNFNDNIFDRLGVRPVISIPLT